MPDKLAKLRELILTYGEQNQIDGWIKEWKLGKAMIMPQWYPEDSPTFSLLQYQSLTESQLAVIVAQLPRGTHLSWQFWRPGQISPAVPMAKQEAFYGRLQGVAEQHGIVLEKANHE
jgi:hypothetical protein